MIPPIALDNNMEKSFTSTIVEIDWPINIISEKNIIVKIINPLDKPYNIPSFLDIFAQKYPPKNDPIIIMHIVIGVTIERGKLPFLENKKEHKDNNIKFIHIPITHPNIVGFIHFKFKELFLPFNLFTLSL